MSSSSEEASESEEEQYEEEDSQEDDDDDDDDGDDDGPREPKVGMHWLNEPEEWMQYRATVEMKVPGGTDFWKSPTDPDAHSDNAPFYYLEMEGDFEVRCKVKAEYDRENDQAGIMIREDEDNWVKCGIQIIDDVPHMCATITHKFSDWSMHPLPHLPEYMWVHAKKIGDGLEVYISEDSFDWMQIRQGDITEESIFQIGLYAASPNGDPDDDEAFEVTFTDFMVKGED